MDHPTIQLSRYHVVDYLPQTYYFLPEKHELEESTDDLLGFIASIACRLSSSKEKAMNFLPTFLLYLMFGAVVFFKKPASNFT